jgi:sporulation protein YlmC with PRC-barrel domain
MKGRFLLTPIAAAVALSTSLAMATTHDVKPPITQTYPQGQQDTAGQQQQPARSDQRSGVERAADQQRAQPGMESQQYGTGTRPGTAAGTTSTTGSPAATGTTGTGAAATGTTDQQATGATARTTAQTGARAGADWERQHRASKIIGMDVVNKQGEKVGDIHDIVLDQQGNVSHAVVSTGGFLGIGERLHAVPWNALDRDAEEQKIVLDVDRDRLRNAPGFDRNNWPNLTDQQWRQDNQRYFPQAGTGAAARGTATTPDATTGMQRGTTGTQQDATGATGQQPGSKAYGTDVDRDRMRQQQGTTGTQGTSGAPGTGTGR